MSQTDRLHIDRKTLEELEILSDNSNSPSIFGMLDRTITRGGKDKLRAIFLEPLGNARTIVSRQDSIRWMSQNPDITKPPFTQALTDKLEVYYFSKAETAVSRNAITRFFESMLYRFKSKGYRQVVTTGTLSTIYFVRSIWAYTNKIRQGEPPEAIQNLIKTITRNITESPLQEALSIKNPEKLSFNELVLWDQRFRGENRIQTVELIDIAYQFDALYALASATLEHSLSFPTIVDSETPHLSIDNVYHLFIKRAIPNTLRFEPGKQFLFLTGPNMAGKTTFLKSCGIAIYLAQIGMAVPASGMTLSPFRAMLSSINTSDNLSIGYSYFYSEVIRVKKAAETLRKHRKVFVMLDELFKGTNIKDAFEGSLMVINGFLQWDSATFILSSHLTELSRKIDKHPKVFFRYFESSVQQGKPIFPYKLSTGVSEQRLGVVILQNENIEALLTPPKE